MRAALPARPAGGAPSLDGPARAWQRGRRVPAARALAASALILLGVPPAASLARLLRRRPSGAVTLVIEPDAARFRARLDREEWTAVLARRGLRLAAGADPLKLAAAVLALPPWTEPAVIDFAGGGPAARVVAGALTLARRRREASAADWDRRTRNLRRAPLDLIRLPLALTP